MTTAPPGFNYAASFGIKSFAAPIVFVILYFPLFAYFFFKSVRRPSYIYIILALFCAIRVTAFILRALLSHDLADAENLNILLAYEIIYNTGFFGLLYSAYTLVVERVAISRNPPSGPITTLLKYHFLFRIFLTAAVVLGITGAIQASTGSTTTTINTGNTLRKAAVYIFLICAILVLLQTIFLARAEFGDGGFQSSNGSVGATYGVYILLVVSVLLVARESFFTATASNITEQNKEPIWYPLAAVTEYLALVLFTVPGLVPDMPKDA